MTHESSRTHLGGNGLVATMRAMVIKVALGICILGAVLSRHWKSYALILVLAALASGCNPLSLGEAQLRAKAALGPLYLEPLPPIQVHASHNFTNEFGTWSGYTRCDSICCTIELGNDLVGLAHEALHWYEWNVTGNTVNPNHAGWRERGWYGLLAKYEARL